MRIQHLAFLTPGNFSDDDPAAGLEATLALLAEGEALGYDSGWVRQRHLERGVSSAATVLAAATQRTRRIQLGVAVVQMGYEQPFRLAEDLATVDLLSGGRLQVGLSAGPPPHGALLGTRLFDGDPAAADFSHARVDRLRDLLRSDWLAGEDVFIESAGGRQRPRLQPHAPGLVDRLWVGGGSLGSAQWAGAAGYHLLIGNLNRAERSDDFWVTQGLQLDAYLAAWRRPSRPRVALGRVLLPTDSADADTRQRYARFAAERHARTLAPQGPRRTLFAPDLVGSADQIVQALRTDPLIDRVSELRLELPYNFERDAYAQILADTAQRLAPQLGWQPAPA